MSAFSGALYLYLDDKAVEPTNYPTFPKHWDLKYNMQWRRPPFLRWPRLPEGVQYPLRFLSSPS
ncbi:hypothetical protein PABY_20840 [Pyrodictium abyssi]|uniref:Uncharacterized protein n=1 Tax=Pyrodictium abyssi TaxID=54256 RepID=A0ABM8IYA2_9CREN|nr:hypothetical protein PABY_20840 [Pyrodictium abyssi]